MNRQEGHYWVKYQSRWIVCEWNRLGWIMCERIFSDVEFEEIDERVARKTRRLYDLSESEAYQLGVYGIYKALHEDGGWSIQMYCFRDIAKLVAAGFDIVSELSVKDTAMVTHAAALREGNANGH